MPTITKALQCNFRDVSLPTAPPWRVTKCSNRSNRRRDGRPPRLSLRWYDPCRCWRCSGLYAGRPVYLPHQSLFFDWLPSLQSAGNSSFWGRVTCLEGTRLIRAAGTVRGPLLWPAARFGALLDTPPCHSRPLNLPSPAGQAAHWGSWAARRHCLRPAAPSARSSARPRPPRCDCPGTLSLGHSGNGLAGTSCPCRVFLSDDVAF